MPLSPLTSSLFLSDIPTKILFAFPISNIFPAHFILFDLITVITSGGLGCVILEELEI
jgi:hypothetical protein